MDREPLRAMSTLMTKEIKKMMGESREALRRARERLLGHCWRSPRRGKIGGRSRV